MSTNNNKKNLLKTICKSLVGCGCRKLKLSDVYEPTPKPTKTSISISHNPNPCNSSSGSVDNRNSGSSSTITTDNEACTSSTMHSFNINIDTSSQNNESEIDLKTYKVFSPCPKIVDSLAVTKHSNDPYKDFRHSMLQMIMEKEIYSKDDLKELLNCFLKLNSPCHHDIIVQVFTEVWHEAISNRPCVDPPS